MRQGSPALYVRINEHDIPAVAVVPIEYSDFDTLIDLKLLVAKQDLPIAVLTPKAWRKLEGLYDV